MSGRERDSNRKAPDAAGLSDESLVAIREVLDEPMATMFVDFLRSEGIEASVVPVQIPWLASVETLLHGYWGRIEVLGRDAERARNLLEDFVAAIPEQMPGEDEP